MPPGWRHEATVIGYKDAVVLDRFEYYLGVVRGGQSATRTPSIPRSRARSYPFALGRLRQERLLLDPGFRRFAARTRGPVLPAPRSTGEGYSQAARWRTAERGH